ncbi:MAG: MlaD family protein [Bacteroidales bacterium]
MKYSGEVKIGITGVVTIVVIIWGINYLKGRNVLSSNYILKAQYEQIDGLESSANVMLDGFKIGTVDNIVFKTEEQIPFTVFLEIDRNYKIRKNSEAVIYSADLLGSKMIKIVQSANDEYMQHGGVLLSSVSVNKLSTLMEDISPLLGNMNAAVMTLDSTGAEINRILRNPKINATISNIESASGSLDNQLSASGDLTRTIRNLQKFSESLQSQNETIRKTIANFEQVSSELESAGIDSLLKSLNQVVYNLSEITSDMKEGHGTMGKLFAEDSLYNRVNQLVADLDFLVKDVQENPKKYVSISLIGK